MLKYFVVTCVGAIRAISTRAPKHEIEFQSLSNPRLYKALHNIGATYMDAAISGNNDELVQSFIVKDSKAGTVVSVWQTQCGKTTVYSSDAGLIEALGEAVGDANVIGHCDGQASS